MLLFYSFCFRIIIIIVIIIICRSLVFKRHVERPQRPWMIWFFDVSKQLVGGFIVHCSNIYVAELLGSGDDECAW
jgi:hypothetical protein